MTNGVSGIAGPIVGIVGMGIGLGLLLGTMKAIQHSNYGKDLKYPFIPIQPQQPHINRYRIPNHYKINNSYRFR
jgi:hypothetical protein